MANIEDPDEMQHIIRRLHCLLRYKQFSGTEINLFTESLTSNPLKYKMDYSILDVSIYMEYSIRMKRVNSYWSSMKAHSFGSSLHDFALI